MERIENPAKVAPQAANAADAAPELTTKPELTKAQTDALFARIGKDLTPAMNRAMLARLVLLNEARPHSDEWQAAWRDFAVSESNPPPLLNVGLLAAGIRICKRRFPREVSRQASVALCRPEEADFSPAVLLFLKRTRRAERLLRHLLTVGVFLRGEVAGAGKGRLQSVGPSREGAGR